MGRFARGALARAPQLQNFKDAVQRTTLKALRRPFEPEFEILKTLQARPDEIYVDIGANRGQSIEAIRICIPKAPILAFEPLYDLAQTLSARFAFDDSVTVMNLGLAAEAGEKTLFVPTYAGYRFDGLASLNREEAEGWLSEKTLVGYRRERLRIEERTISLAALDSFGVSPAFVKIDVQGAEAEVLEGARETLGRQSPVLIVEGGVESEPSQILSSFGYEDFAFVKGRLTPRTRSTRNGVFIHPQGARGLEGLISR